MQTSTAYTDDAIVTDKMTTRGYDCIICVRSQDNNVNLSIVNSNIYFYVTWICWSDYTLLGLLKQN